MADPDSPLRFPCWLLLSSTEDVPQLIEIDGNVCVCLFADRKALEAFHRGKYQEQADSTPIQVCPLANGKDVASCLRNLQHSLDEQNCRHLAINPRPDQPLMYATIGEIIEESGRS